MKEEGKVWRGGVRERGNLLHEAEGDRHQCSYFWTKFRLAASKNFQTSVSRLLCVHKIMKSVKSTGERIVADIMMLITKYRLHYKLCSPPQYYCHIFL